MEDAESPPSADRWANADPLPAQPRSPSPSPETGASPTTRRRAPKTAESAALSSQTLKHHLKMCLKLIGTLYSYHEERRSEKGDGEGRKECKPAGEDGGDREYLTVVMLNSALLKAMHVVDSFQNFILAETPELASQVGDHLISFDGTLTTIYEGEDATTPNERVEVPPMPEEARPGQDRVSPAGSRLADDITALLSSSDSAPEPEESSGGTGGPAPADGGYALRHADVARLVSSFKRLSSRAEAHAAEVSAITKERDDQQARYEELLHRHQEVLGRQEQKVVAPEEVPERGRPAEHSRPLRPEPRAAKPSFSAARRVSPSPAVSTEPSPSPSLPREDFAPSFAPPRREKSPRPGPQPVRHWSPGRPGVGERAGLARRAEVPRARGGDARGLPVRGSATQLEEKQRQMERKLEKLRESNQDLYRLKQAMRSQQKSGQMPTTIKELSRPVPAPCPDTLGRSASTPSLSATVGGGPTNRAAMAATRARTPKPLRARDPMTTSTAALYGVTTASYERWASLDTV